MRRACILAGLLSVLLSALLCGCGKAETVRILDGDVVTSFDAPLPQTVGALLDRAEITLLPGDTVSPAPDALIRRGQDIQVIRSCVVLLCIDGEARTAVACGGTVGDLLDREGIVLHEGQHLSCSPDAALKDGMEIWISERVSIRIRHDGTTEYFSVAAGTVGDALSLCGIGAGVQDRVSPSTDTPLREGMEIEVERVQYETLTQEEPIAFETVYQKDEALPLDSEQIQTPGKDGLREATYSLTIVDGREEARTLISETVLVEPIAQVVLRGPKNLANVSILSKKAFYDCDGSGHGYYEIRYSDGTVEYENF